MDSIPLATQERAAFVELLETLTPEQWRTPTLCAGWTVHDLVAHVISFDELGPGAVLRRLTRAGFNPNRANAIGLEEYRGRSPEELVGLLKKYVRPRGFTTLFGGMIALTDCTIHHQDVRRPLGLPREISQVQLDRVLRFALFAPVIRGVLVVRGVRLVATDLDWSFGRGPQVRGSAEALLMVIAGRRGITPELSGPGVGKLVARVGS